MYGQPSAVRPASIFSMAEYFVCRKGLPHLPVRVLVCVTLRLVLSYRRYDVSSVFPLYSVMIGL